MKIRRLHRVDLLVAPQDIASARTAFNAVLGGHLPSPTVITGQSALTTTDLALRIRLTEPDHGATRTGAVGAIVWEVDDYEDCRREVSAGGYRIVREFGEPDQREMHLDPAPLFGFQVGFTERRGEGVGEPSSMVTGFDKLELLVGGDEIDDAVRTFNLLLSARIAEPQHLVEQDVLTTTDFETGIELLAPASPNSTVQRSLERKGRGSIGPIVWRIDDVDAARERALDLGHRIAFEFQRPGRHQVHLDPEQLHGFGLTFVKAG